MTPSQIATVQRTYAQVLPAQEAVAHLFYYRLFELDPHANALFSGRDMADQGRMFMSALSIVVDGLSDLSHLLPAIRELARRHAGYGVHGIDYEYAGEALLWALEQALGDDFTPEVRKAWQTVYSALANDMIEMSRDQVA